jgi:hypothetical protein
LLLASVVLANQSVACPEIPERAAISEAAQEAFLREDYSQLEKTAHSYRATRSRTASGTWKLTYFYIGILDAIDALAEAQEREAAFGDLQGRMKRWTQEYPDSPSAHLMQSSVQEAHKAVAAADPRWYQTMIMIAMAEGWEREEFDRLLDAALDREPVYYQTYFQAIDYLMPKWHGEISEIEEFAQDAVRSTSALEGRGM